MSRPLSGFTLGDTELPLFTEAIPWPGTAWLACVTRYPIRQSFWYQYPRIMDTYLPITSQLRILSHLYPLTLQNGNGSPLFFVLHYIFKQTLPTREMVGKWELHITLTPGMYLCFVRNRHRPQCRSTMKDWYCDTFCKSSWRGVAWKTHMAGEKWLY